MRHLHRVKTCAMSPSCPAEHYQTRGDMASIITLPRSSKQRSGAVPPPTLSLAADIVAHRRPPAAAARAPRGALQPREAAAARRRRASGTPLPLPPPRARQSWTSLPHTWHSGRCSRPRRTRVAPPQQAKLYSPVTVLLRCRANRKEQIRPDGRAAGRRTLQGLALGPVVVLIGVEAAMAAPGEISALQLLPGSAETAEIGSGNLHFLVFERPRGQAR